jgi:glycerol-3-phosphate responsive antiterminator
LGRLPARYIAGLGVPILAGGLISTRADISAALASGATAVSTSTESLWGASK